MQAIVQDRYGSPGVLQTRDIAKPQITDNEVLVHVHAASVHLGDLILMTGTPYLMRMATGLSKPKIRVPGPMSRGRSKRSARMWSGFDQETRYSVGARVPLPNTPGLRRITSSR